MSKSIRFIFVLWTISIFFSACASVDSTKANFDVGEIKFSARSAFQIEEAYVLNFPNRHSGQESNLLAAEYFVDKLSSVGWVCSLDQWSIINYSETVELNNAVCRLPGLSQREILVAAHHDQAPTTIQGADNDGAGISILIHLGEIFGEEAPLPYTLVFVSTDAEEYGMIGSRRFVQTHPDPSQIIAGISLDNLGRHYYDGMNMELIGQYRNYAPIWLPLAAREAAMGAGSVGTMV